MWMYISTQHLCAFGLLRKIKNATESRFSWYLFVLPFASFWQALLRSRAVWFPDAWRDSKFSGCTSSAAVAAKVESLLEGQHAQYAQHAGQSGGKLCKNILRSWLIGFVDKPHASSNGKVAMLPCSDVHVLIFFESLWSEANSMGLHFVYWCHGQGT